MRVCLRWSSGIVIMKNNKNLNFIIKSFIGWRLLLFVLLAIGIYFVPLQNNFLGGGLGSYMQNPYFWAWSNFDGEHYLAIAYEGYRPLTYFYFPVFPLIIKFVGNFLGGSFISYATSGLIISNILFLIGLIGIYKLLKIDNKQSLLKTTLFLLFLFPTSFYFGSVYTESLFLALSVWSFYFARKKRWIFAGLLGAILTATRVTGLALIPALLVEAYLQYKSEGKKEIVQKLLGLLTIPLGICIYTYFLKITTGDPLEFVHNVAIFGQQRQSTLVLLPQVFYRYFFKVFPNINYDYFPVVFSTFLEIVTAIIFLALVLLGFIKQRLSYATYSLFAYLIPTFSGSFSSFPRYVLLIFPSFILTAEFIQKLKPKVRLSLYTLMGITLIIALSLFSRGYWIS